MKSATLLTLAICLSVLLVPEQSQAQAYAPAYTPGSWNWVDKDDLNQAVGYFSAVPLNGKIYAFGGATSPTTGSNQIQEYDVASDTWTVSPYVLPQPLVGMAAVELGGAIYVIGGAESYVETPLSNVYRFHPGTGFDPVATIANLPAPRMFHSACVAPDGKIYVIGGIDVTNQSYKTVFIYDPVNNTWTNGYNIHYNRLSHTSVVVGNKIYVMGGTSDFFSGMNSVEVFDLNNPSQGWVIAPHLTRPRVLHGSAVVLNNKIITLGGINNTTTAELSVEGFDPETNGDRWDHFCDLPFERRAFGCVGIGNEIFLIGGNSGSSVITSTQVLQLTTAAHELSPVESPIALLPNMPNPFDQGTSIAFRISESADIAISVFDAAGQLIFTPVSGRYGAGEYRIPVDGAGLDAGIYFCVLNSNYLSPIVQKWVVIRK
jgi:N-acetylneuraminic acid mutarotase